MTSKQGSDFVLTDDSFLGGKLSILQPKPGFRSGIDAVLLAASVPAMSGQSVLELGCGVGVASLCLSARVAGLTLTGVELQDAYADLARQNAARNDHNLTAYTADLEALPSELRQQSFDHVFANPPYYAATSRTKATNAGRETALEEDTPLQIWVEVARKRLKPRGQFTMIYPATRLPDVLAALGDGFGGVIVQPLAPRVGDAPHLILVQATKSSRAPFRLLATQHLHTGHAHDADRESYTPEINAVLRDGHPFSLG